MSQQPGPGLQRQPLAPLVAGAVALVAALIIQFGLARSGRSPFVPTYSAALALCAIGIVILVFGLRLKRLIADKKRIVDPFHAVRVLVAARAGALVGGLFGGFGAGLALSLLGRSVPAATAIWLPMIAVCAAGIFLAVCGVLAERWCRVPPGDDETRANEDGETGPESQAAYRRP